MAVVLERYELLRATMLILADWIDPNYSDNKLLEEECRGQEHGAVTNNGNDGPHPLDPPLPTLGEGEDLVKNR